MSLLALVAVLIQLSECHKHIITDIYEYAIKKL